MCNIIKSKGTYINKKEHLPPPKDVARNGSDISRFTDALPTVNITHKYHDTPNDEKYLFVSDDQPRSV